MNIDIGAPSEFGVSGIDRRIEKLNKIIKIPYGVNLDLGTGIGAYYPNLKKYSKTLYAFDGELTYLRQFYDSNILDRNRIFISNAESIALKTELFDAVFAIEVLEHVSNLNLVLSEIYRILRSGGLFFITVPNKYFPLETHMVEIRNFSMKGKYLPFLSMFGFLHKKIGTARRFSKKDIYANFTKLGFEVVGLDYMMPPFDYSKFGKKYFRGLTDALENSYLKFFGMTLIVVLKKN